MTSRSFRNINKITSPFSHAVCMVRLNYIDVVMLIKIIESRSRSRRRPHFE